MIKKYKNFDAVRILKDEMFSNDVCEVSLFLGYNDKDKKAAYKGLIKQKSFIRRIFECLR